jgi:hypothetical protein
MATKIGTGADPDPDNKLRKSGGFARVPWCFRKLINRVLTYREAAVYLQIALHCNKDEAYDFGMEKLAECLGWRRTNALYACLNKLVDTGFLLKYRIKTSGPRRYRVNVYQRPAVGYTLRTLQGNGYVGPGKRIPLDEFDKAYELYEKKDRPHEPAKFHFTKPLRKEAKKS